MRQKETRKRSPRLNLGWRRGLMLESLEARQLLDSQLGDAIIGDDFCQPAAEAQPAEAQAAFQTFSSDQELKDYLVKQAVQQYYHNPRDLFLFDGFADFDTVAVAAPGAGPEASDTNVQVDGVDEADLVETDGKFIYVLSGGELTIVDVQQPDDLQVASQLDVSPRQFSASGVEQFFGDYNSQQMFLQGDRLSILASGWTGGTLTIVDVTDRTAPTMIEQTSLEGRIVNSRAIGSQVYLVLDQSWDFPYPEFENGFFGPAVDPLIDFAICDCVDGWWGFPSEPEEEYRQRLESTPLESFFAFDYVSGGRQFKAGSYLAADDFYLPITEGIDPRLTAVVVFDVSDDEVGPSDSVGLPGVAAEEVFMNHESLYLFSYAYGFAADETNIAKLTIDNDEGLIEPVATGMVPGRLLNRFSAGEHEGYLQVATTNGWRSSNNVYVLNQAGAELTITGSVEGFAPTEMIYSARFYGTRGYVVTFRKVDPLFTFDLSDPNNPTIVGDLHIPGYSDYLQAIDENHLIGIGRNADENTGLFQELQISLFDVSDFASPRLVDRHSFAGGRNTWSEAAFEPHAVSYFASHGILAIPIYNQGRWSGDFGGVDNTEQFKGNQSALPVFRIDVDRGIEQLAAIEFEDRVRRSVRVGDVLFAISGTTIKSHRLTNLDEQLDALTYRTEETINPFDKIVGDVNGDGRFDSSDLIQVFQRGQYEDGISRNSAYADGDWNGDGEFSSSDLVLAFQAGTYVV